MKRKIVLLILLFLLIASSVYAVDPRFCGLMKATATGCTDCGGCSYLGYQTQVSNDVADSGMALWNDAAIVPSTTYACSLGAYLQGTVNTTGTARVAIVDSATSATANVKCQSGIFTGLTVGSYAWYETIGASNLNCILTPSANYYLIIAIGNNYVWTGKNTTAAQDHYKTQAAIGCPSNDCVVNGFPAQVNLSGGTANAGPLDLRMGYK